MDMYEFHARGQSRVDDETEDLAHKVIGAAIEVHRHLSAGLPESVYLHALSHELDLRGIEHVCEAAVPIDYKGKRVGDGRMDLLVGGKLIVELKVVEHLVEVHRAQCIGYLCATHLKLALLINFNVAVLRDGVKRVIRTP